MRQCPFDDCGEIIDTGLFACKRHWYSLTKTQRDRIWAVWNQYREGTLSIDELRATQEEVLQQARGAKT